MLTSRCIRSIARVSSSARLACRTSRLHQGNCSDGVSLKVSSSRILQVQPTPSHSLVTQSKYGRRFMRSLALATAACDITRIPQILSNTIIEGAGVDTDITEDDDEMSSPVKGKHRKYTDYQHWYSSK